MKANLSIESIWEDEDLFEVRVKASNGLFSGSADCYTNRDEIAKLAESIQGFPKRIGQEVLFSTGGRDDISFFSLSFKCIDGSGHVIARIKVAHIDSYINAPQENYIAEFDIKVEASAIDVFVNSLKSLSKENIGQISATLQGKT